MAVTLDKTLGTGNSGANAAVTVTTTNAVAVDAHVIVIAGHFFNGVRTATCAGGGLTWTEDAGLRAVDRHIKIFRAPAPAGLAASTALTVTWNGAGDNIAGAGSFNGIDTTGTVIASQTNNAATAAWSSGTVASTNGNALIGGAFIDGVAGSSTETAPGVELFDLGVGGQTETCTGVYKLSVAGSDVIDGTWSGAAAWVAAAVCYKAAVTAITGGPVAWYVG